MQNDSLSIHRPAGPATPSPWPPRAHWNTGLLHAFTLHMAAHQRCVSESMMLGDPAYARAQLRYACVLQDPVLQQIAVGMLAVMGPCPAAADTSAMPRQWTH